MTTTDGDFVRALTGGVMVGSAYEVRLPAGLPLLSANGREHWRPKAAATRTIRDTAHLAAKGNLALRRAMLAARGGPVMERAHVLAVLHPTDRRRRDPANVYPAVKAALDGIVDAGVLADDDSTRVIGPDMRLGPTVRGSQLVLWLRPVRAER